MIIVLAVVILLENLREKRSVPRLNSQVLHALKILVAHQLNIAGIVLEEMSELNSPSWHGVKLLCNI